MPESECSPLVETLTDLAVESNLVGTESGAFLLVDSLPDGWQEVQRCSEALVSGAADSSRLSHEVGDLWIATRRLEQSLKQLAPLLERLSLALSGQELIAFELGGVELEALLGAASVAMDWTFESSIANRRMHDLPTRARSWLHERVLRQAEQHWAARGLVAGPWTSERVAARAVSRIQLALTRPEIRIAVTVLRAASEEFAEDWDEFQTVTGCSHHYAAPHGILCELAARLEGSE